MADPVARATDDQARGRYPTLAKARNAFRLPPNLPDYDTACRDFSWASARRMLDGLPGGGGLNIAHEAVDRHAAGPLAARAALRWIGKDGQRRDLTYGDLRRDPAASPTCSGRWASARGSGSSCCSAGSPSSMSPPLAR